METLMDEMNAVRFTVCTLLDREKKRGIKQTKEAISLILTYLGQNQVTGLAMITELTVRVEKKNKKSNHPTGYEHLPSSPTNHCRLLAVNYGDVCESSPSAMCETVWRSPCPCPSLSPDIQRWPVYLSWLTPDDVYIYMHSMELVFSWGSRPTQPAARAQVCISR